MFKLSYIMGLGKTTGGKTSIIGYIISQKNSFVNNLFQNFKKGFIFQIVNIHAIVIILWKTLKNNTKIMLKK